MAQTGAIVAGLAGAVPAGLRESATGRDPARLKQAAQQFEGLLIEQLLRSARGNGEGWLGGGGDAAGGCATDFAEQQLATVLAANGGIGLAGLVVRGLESAAGSSSPKPAGTPGTP